MATTLAEVKDNLPNFAVNEGWDDAKIQAMIDAQTSLGRIMLTYWQGKAAATSEYVSVSESGSTRSLSDVYNNAVEMMKYWRDVVAKEEAATDDNPGFRRIGFGRITRV